MYTIWVRGEVYICEIITTMYAINIFYDIKYASKSFLPSFLIIFSLSDYFESWHCLTLRSTFFRSVNILLIFYYFSVDSYGSVLYIVPLSECYFAKEKISLFHDLVSVLKLQGIFNNIKPNTENQIPLWKYLFITNLFHWIAAYYNRKGKWMMLEQCRRHSKSQTNCW